LVYYMWMCLEYNGGNLGVPTVEWLRHFPLPTVSSVAIVAGWFLFQGLLQIYAPGKWVDGTPLADGTRLQYRMNGWFSWWFTWAVLAGAVLLGTPATILADQFGPLMTTVNLFTYLLCFVLYWHGKRTGTSYERITNNPIYDFWLGTALNPRV